MLYLWLRTRTQSLLGDTQMKKLFAGIIAGIMMAAGLVAFTGTAANADCDGYGACPPSTTRISAPDRVRQRTRATIGVRVTSSRVPRGQVRVVVSRNAGGFRWVDTKAYSGEKVFFRTPRLRKRGGYTITARFTTERQMRHSSDTDSFRVVRR